MSRLLELLIAANFLGIPSLYQCACQSVAAWVKGKSLDEISKGLRHERDLGQAGIRKIRMETFLSSVFDGACIKNVIYIPNEVFVTIFEKLLREELERLQLVSTQFNDVIVSSRKLFEQQGPLCVVAKVDFSVVQSMR
ncbi:hypothetical protein AAVH_08486 [Aphelenchoides avenae]|nr:hypothetical protein AAVH_08486 [Aphelenchus avenae]